MKSISQSIWIRREHNAIFATRLEQSYDILARKMSLIQPPLISSHVALGVSTEDALKVSTKAIWIRERIVMLYLQETHTHARDTRMSQNLNTRSITPFSYDLDDDAPALNGLVHRSS